MPQLKSTRGIILNRSHLLSRGLVGLWLFNEGSGGQVFDLSGNGNTGTLTGTSPSWSYGKFGSAVLLPGTNEYVNCGKKNVLEVGSGDFTIWAWFKPTDNSDYKLVNKGSVGTGGKRYSLEIDDTVLEFEIDDDSTYQTIQGTTVLSGGTWYFGLVRRKGNVFSVWLNGIEENNVTHSGYGSLDDSSKNFCIGINSADEIDKPYNGVIDNVGFANRALSASEIALLYREPFCMFERAWIPKLIGSQIVELIGTSAALSSLSATTKATRKVGGNVVGTSDVAAILNSTRGLPVIEKNWLTESLFNGMTANAFKLGTTLSLGWFWARVAGCSALYRGSSMEEIDFVNILAVAEQDACEISPPSYISHNSGSTYFYVVRRFNNIGYQERTLAASVKVSIESNGELAQPQPNKIFDSGAELVDGNKIQLVWYYCPLAQKSQPMCFNVYYDGQTGQINYENPLAIIGYKGRKFYNYQCGALEAGRYLFAIRTEDASGIENSSLARLIIQFDPTNPDAIDILSVEGV